MPLRSPARLLPVLAALLLPPVPAGAEPSAAPAGGAPPARQAAELEEVAVIGDREQGYQATTASTANRSETPLLETPASVQVVPAQVIEDIRASRLDGALELVSGVRSNNNQLEGYVFTIRGFNVLDVFRNGLKSSVAIPTIYDSANLERVEVLKGPASILFGRVDPGGVINRVTKAPLREATYRVEQEVASFGHLRTAGDLSGPILEGGALGYRVTGAYQRTDGFRDFQAERRWFLSPVVSWSPTSSTTLVLDVEHLHNDAQSDQGLVARGDRPAPVPIRRSLQEPNDPLDATRTTQASATLRQELGGSFTLTARGQMVRGLLEKLNVALLGELDPSTQDRFIQYQRLAGHAYGASVDLTGEVRTGPLRHRLLAGLDLYRDDYEYQYGGNGSYPMDIYAPVYGTVPDADLDRDFALAGFAFYSAVDTWQAGLYLQDQVTFLDSLHLLLGGRFDRAWLTNGTSEVSPDDARANAPATEQRDDAFSPRAGLLWQPAPWASTYLSYSRSFGANNGTTATGARIDPQLGTQYEAGLKAEPPGLGLTASLALYQLTKSNILTSDLSTPDPNDVVPLGETRSRGLELDVLGRITDQVSLVASYAFTDTRVTADANGYQGNRAVGVPRHAASAWVTWEAPAGTTLGGLRLGGGLFGADRREGDAENTYVLPGYLRADAFARYGGGLWRGRWWAQLNVRNLTNVAYYEGVDSFYNGVGRVGLFPGAGRTITGTVALEY